jgi:hypothetical protein
MYSVEVASELHEINKKLDMLLERENNADYIKLYRLLSILPKNKVNAVSKDVAE